MVSVRARGLKAAAIACMALCLAGCAIGRFAGGSQIAEARIADIKPGVTTRQEILEWFGPPQNYASPTLLNQILRDWDATGGEPLTSYPFANILTYEFDRANLKGVLLILFNYIRVDSRSDRLVIFFDENERVKYYGFHKGTAELR